MQSVVQGCTSISDGVPLDTKRIGDLDYTGSSSNHNQCTQVTMKYGFFGFDYSYDQTNIAGCNVQYVGHGGGVISISTFSTAHLGSNAYCISDFAVGGGYYDM